MGTGMVLAVDKSIANDVIACGVSPKGLSLDIGINIFEDEEEVFKFIDGVLEVCSHYNMKYEGGNMSKSNYVCGSVCTGCNHP